ncbi:MAG: hypothetical protein J5I47_13350 [Vicingus serpentipes]|nr:hypothetical protein [Vicingus serpentipes]
MSINEKKLAGLGWDGQDNVGGIRHTEIYFAATDWFADNGIKKPSTHLGATSLEDLATISTSHVLLTGYGFMKITATPKTGNVESTLAGEDDGKVSNNKFTFMKPGSKAEVLGFQRKFQNRDGIWLVKEVDGQIRQIGSEEIPARMASVTNTLGGGGYDGKKGSTFEIEDFNAAPAPVYTGDIQLATESSAS